MTVKTRSKEDQLIVELSRLRSIGMEVVPIKEKEAFICFKGRRTLPIDQIEGFIRNGRATGLGLRLGGTERVNDFETVAFGL